MKFKDYKYERPELESIKKSYSDLLDALVKADDEPSFFESISAINKLRNSVDTMATIASIRHSIDTRDEFYDGENDFFDETTPILQEFETSYYKIILEHKFKDSLIKKYGRTIVDIAKLSQKTFSPEIIPLLQRENALASEYVKLISSAKIEFGGKVNNLSQMTPFTQDTDREIRKSASEKVSEFFEQNEAEIDRIYDEMVKVRHEIATKLGYENFVDLAYARLGRVEYNHKDVENYRKQVFEDLVPLSQEYRTRQAARIGIEDFKYYDEALSYKSGNPTPKGDEAYLVGKAAEMYNAMSDETGEFFKYMTDGELLDLSAKEGKAGGGYCTFIKDYKSPFIFSNFNGTAGDVDVLTHEAGHAFQVFSSRNYELPEYVWCTLEACEIHSMSMEFFAWPWMEGFFKEDTEKYKFEHLSSAVLFIPYGVSVDEFQHFVYEHPEASPAERKAKWREIEKKYLPHRDYGDNAMLEKGTYWYKQGHIFSMPFYYIDYTLAQICALQFWGKSQVDREKAFADYVKLCKKGGSDSFLNLVDYAGLKNPFVDGTIKETLKPVAEYLKKVDDSKF